MICLPVSAALWIEHREKQRVTETKDYNIERK